MVAKEGSSVVPKAREDRLFVEEVGDELVVYDQDRQRVHRLSRTAALVWRHCDGQKTVAELAAVLRNKVDAVADEDLIWVALSRLEAAHLLEESLGRSPEELRSSRRQFVHKATLVGVVSLLLPVVATLPRPTLAHGLSPKPKHKYYKYKYKKVHNKWVRWLASFYS